MILVNARTAQTLASDVAVARTRAARRRGLLGRDHMNPSEALVLSPCRAIHTMFMRFAIDVIFLGVDGRAVRIVQDLPPWRMAGAAGAQAVVELPAGALRLLDVRVGDGLSVRGPDSSL